MNNIGVVRVEIKYVRYQREFELEEVVTVVRADTFKNVENDLVHAMTLDFEDDVFKKPTHMYLCSNGRGRVFLSSYEFVALSWIRIYFFESYIATVTFLLCWKKLRLTKFQCINSDVARKIARLIYDSFRDPIWGQQKSKIKRLKQNE